MNNNPIHPNNKSVWSEDATKVGLPQALKASPILSSRRGDDLLKAHDRVFPITINEVWKKIAIYALEKIANGSRDSDRLAQEAARRACLPVPSLEILTSFPFAKLSSVQLASSVRNTLSEASALLLQNVLVATNAEPPSSESELVQNYNATLLSECDRVVDRICQLQDESRGLLLLSFAHQIEALPPSVGLRDAQTGRSALLEKIARALPDADV